MSYTPTPPQQSTAANPPIEVTLILPLSDYYRSFHAFPQGKEALEATGISSEEFIAHILDNYNELNEIDKRLEFLEDFLMQATRRTPPDYYEMVTAVEVFDEMSQMLAISIDRFLVLHGMSLTYSSHDLKVIRFVGPDAVMVKIMPPSDE